MDKMAAKSFTLYIAKQQSSQDISTPFLIGIYVKVYCLAMMIFKKNSNILKVQFN